MAPSAEERLAALETDRNHNKEELGEIKQELKRLPRRISKQMERLLTECRAMQDAKQLTKKDRTPPADDYSWLKKLLIVGLFVGSVIGGIYQVTQDQKPNIPAILQGVK